MRAVTASITCSATVHQAITAWCETERWPQWVEGLEEVVSVTSEWPAAGGIVRWRSSPAGRGHVTERILAYEPLRSVESEIIDDQVTARQLVTFTPAGPPATTAGPPAEDRTEVTVDFGYRITRRSPITPVIDWLFVRPAMTNSLRTTLSRFAAEVRAGD
jgi:hypothetical protein